MSYDQVLKGVFKTFLLDIAEGLILKRRLKIREKKYQLFKDLQHSNLENNKKHREIDKIIEVDYKYFGAYYKDSD